MSQSKQAGARGGRVEMFVTCPNCGEGFPRGVACDYATTCECGDTIFVPMLTRKERLVEATDETR